MTEIKSELGFNIVTFGELDTVGLSLEVGDIFTVSLNEDPSTGFHWHDEVINDDPDVIMRHLESYVPGEVLGGPGTRKFEYGVHKNGSAHIVFSSSKADEEPVSVKTLYITVD